MDKIKSAFSGSYRGYPSSCDGGWSKSAEKWCVVEETWAIKSPFPTPLVHRSTIVRDLTACLPSHAHLLETQYEHTMCMRVPQLLSWAMDATSLLGCTGPAHSHDRFIRWRSCPVIQHNTNDQMTEHLLQIYNQVRFSKSSTRSPGGDLLRQRVGQGTTAQTSKDNNARSARYRLWKCHDHLNTRYTVGQGAFLRRILSPPL